MAAVNDAERPYLRVSGTKDSLAKALDRIRVFLNDNYVEEFAVPHKMVGSVVGKGGKTIQKLELDSGATMQIQTRKRVRAGGGEETVEGLMLLRGTRESVERAKGAVLRLLEEATPVEEVVNIERSLGGAVVGKGGNTIRQIMVRVSCHGMFYLFFATTYSHARHTPHTARRTPHAERRTPHPHMRTRHNPRNNVH